MGTASWVATALYGRISAAKDLGLLVEATLVHAGGMTATLTPTSRTADLGGPTHYLDFGGPANGPVMVCVHGLGGAAWNWLGIAPRLTDRFRVLAIDLAGHGLTPAADRTTSVPANRRLLDRFIREVVDQPVTLVGNSMGGLITALETAASPDLVSAAVLIDPALPRPFGSKVEPSVALRFALVMLPGLGEAVLSRRDRRQTPEQQMRETLALCTVDASRIPADVIAAGLEVARTRSGERYTGRDFLQAARSLIRLLSRPRQVHARLARITAPVLLLHGDKDRLVSLTVAQAAAKRYPAWQLEVAHDVGHVPMLEVPDWTVDRILEFTQRHAERRPAG